MARGLKFWIYEVEGLYYPCSENKDADQLRGYREADLRLCFRICKNPVFSRRGSYAYGITGKLWNLICLKKKKMNNVKLIDTKQTERSEQTGNLLITGTRTKIRNSNNNVK